MKPRSSSAVISRWMPDLERRSSASFISSKEGGTPDFGQALVDEAQEFELLAGQHLSVSPGRSRAQKGNRPETNHERTLSVPYVFRNHLIWSEKVERPLKAELKDDAG